MAAATPITPPSAGPSNRNAISECPITPFLRKTSSVPLTYRSFGATAVDEELAAELHDAMIHEEIQIGNDNTFVKFWTQLSKLSNLSQIRAQDIETDDHKKFYDNGRWEPSLIPHILRHRRLAGHGAKVAGSLQDPQDPQDAGKAATGSSPRGSLSKDPQDAGKATTSSSSTPNFSGPKDLQDASKATSNTSTWKPSGSRSRRKRGKRPARSPKESVASASQSLRPEYVTRFSNRPARLSSGGRAEQSVPPGNQSLRREVVTRSIPDTTLQETIVATVIPCAGFEENGVATWLNLINSAFDTLPILLSSDSPESPPDGCVGPVLQSSKSKAQAKETASPRRWSSQYSTKPVRGFPLMIKPDIVFCGQLGPQKDFAWHDALSFLELTSSPYNTQLERNITRKAYALFMSQPCRRFVVAISIARQDFRLHVYDHSGVIHSRGHNIHNSADLFLRVIYVLNFGNPTALGFDPTFINPTLSPLVVFRPSTKRPDIIAQKVYVGDRECSIVRCIFLSPLVRGRATTAWVVSWKKKQYVVKD